LCSISLFFLLAFFFYQLLSNDFHLSFHNPFIFIINLLFILLHEQFPFWGNWVDIFWLLIPGDGVKNWISEAERGVCDETLQVFIGQTTIGTAVRIASHVFELVLEWVIGFLLDFFSEIYVIIIPKGMNILRTSVIQIARVERKTRWICKSNQLIDHV
jgi:hypothetical protein